VTTELQMLSQMLAEEMTEHEEQVAELVAKNKSITAQLDQANQAIANMRQEHQTTLIDLSATKAKLVSTMEALAREGRVSADLNQRLKEIIIKQGNEGNKPPVEWFAEILRDRDMQMRGVKLKPVQQS
jgi:uncharacterized coiled-coil DUF342 family protein